MKLCMFHPADKPMERGWVGRLDGDRVLHLAAQTLQAFFLGGGGAREHAEYALADVTLLVPVLFPPAVRVFDDTGAFAFANPAAVLGPDVAVRPPAAGALVLEPRLAAVIGADGAIGGYAPYAALVALDGPPAPKDRDFGSVLGPVVVTPDELPGADLGLRVTAGGAEVTAGALANGGWEARRALAAEGTLLRPGDLLVGPCAAPVQLPDRRGAVELAVEGVGELRFAIDGRP